MRITFLLLLFVTGISAQSIQDKVLLDRTDFKLADGRMIATDVGCVIPGEVAAFPIQISIVCLQNAFHKTGVGKINDMILYADGKVRSAVAGAYTPSEFRMAYNPSTKLWSLTSLFSTEQSGVVTRSLMALDFDSAGNFLEMKRVF